MYDAGNFQKTVSKTSLHFQNVSDIPVFNLIKIHGSINWREEDDCVKNDIGLPTVKVVKAALDAIVHMKEYPLASSDCRKRAEENFDKDKCFEKYIELYENLLK